MLDSVIIQDTIHHLTDTIACNVPNTGNVNNSLLDTLYKVSMIVIAICNFVFSLYIFVSKNSKEDIDKEANRKLGLLKTLVLDHKLSILYNKFSELSNETKILLTKKMSDQEKSNLDEKLAEIFISLRLEFVLLLSAVDEALYVKILASLDRLQEKLTTALFDSGINLDVNPKYNYYIQKPINDIQISIIKELFKYKGK